MLKEINNMTRLREREREREREKNKNKTKQNKETEIIFHLPIVRKYGEVIKVFISVVCITKTQTKVYYCNEHKKKAYTSKIIV